MTHRIAMWFGFIAAGAMTASLAAAEPSRPALQPTVGPAQPVATAIQLAPSIDLVCSGAGASDVASRKHSIKNSTAFPIPKGTTILWSASNKGSGRVVLAENLAPNASVDVMEPGSTSGYTCTARFSPGPADFAVKKVQWTSATTATVEIANLNPWTDAAASTARVASMRCAGSATVQSLDVPVPAIPKGASTTLTVTIAKANADYLMATANANNAVSELAENKANNVGKSPEFSSNKSCTPH